MARQDVDVTSFDHEDLKQSLIDFLKASGKFDEFDFEGSAINTLIDMLVRNTHYDSFLANMLANESFIDGAQIRGNVVSHAQKLSYTPRSATASRAIIDVKVIPADKTNLDTTIEIPTNTVFLATVNGESFQFITNDSYIMTLDSNNDYVVSDVEIFQGQRIENSFVHIANDTIEIPNSRIDTSTLAVSSLESGEQYVFELAESISELTLDRNFYFLSENYRQNYEVEFGKNIISREPENNSAITVSYINTETEHANGASSFIPASTINGYANIEVDVTQNSYGGSDREEIEDIRFLAPKTYQAQDRAVVESDYSILVKKRFPFIQSLKTWGGEDNDPPRYGVVFMSIISDQGQVLTRSIKREILSYLEDYNIGSITNEIVDSEGIGLDLTVHFAFDSRLTNRTFNQLKSEIDTIVDTYNDNNLERFDNYYNDSKLSDLIMDIRGIETVNIEKTAKVQFDVLRFDGPSYSYNMKNPLTPGTFIIDNFSADANATSQVITDDTDGNIVYTKTVSGVTTDTDIGTIDYDSGEFEFSINMIQDDLRFFARVEPLNENFYVYNNKYLYIDTTTFELIETFPKR